MKNKKGTLVVTALADKNLDDDWTAIVQQPERLSGVFGIGPTMREARQALAANIAASPTIAAHYAKVQVLTLTRKTFTIADLINTTS